MSHLLLTLGHNSSAILVESRNILIGYENERLTKKKSDSSFPIEAIMEISKWYPLEEVTEVYISHWFTSLTIPLNEQGKWYNEEALKRVLTNPDLSIYTLTPEFSHHDAHKYSASCFIGNKFPENAHTIVMDGFGSYGETCSIYENDSLIHRSYGFASSLGLYFQYATSFLDLKENQDEYKLLGYEADINQYSHMKHLLVMADTRADAFVDTIINYTLDQNFDPLINISALVAIKKTFRDEFDKVINSLGIKEEFEKRVAISFYVQTVLEMTVLRLIKYFDMTDIKLVGGVFMNVKLSNEIANTVEGKITVMPLCGDQGAAIGLYYRDRALDWPNHLFWGNRSTIHAPDLLDVDPQGIINLLAQDKIVNLVRGNMEFGARALGHTSTLALPHSENVDYINHINGRSSIMPMAPILSEKASETFFVDKDKVVESLHYMSCARYCSDHVDPMNYGVTHSLPYSETVRTCRPQVLRDDPYLEPVLDAFGVLINTSFNKHGTPIVFDTHDVTDCHNYQKERDHDDRVVTVVLENNE